MSSPSVDSRRGTTLSLNNDESVYSPLIGRGGFGRTFATFLCVTVLPIVVLSSVNADTEYKFEPQDLVISIEQAYELARAQDAVLKQVAEERPKKKYKQVPVRRTKNA